MKLQFPELGYGWDEPLQLWSQINEDRLLFVHCLREMWKDESELVSVASELGVPLDDPNSVSDDAFKSFVVEVVKAVQFSYEDADWKIALNDKYQQLLKMNLQETMLDRVLGVDAFVLSLTGDLDEAEKIQKMIDKGESDKAADYYKESVGLL